jgi:two-component system nitrogen regulation response regulator NtrX
LSKERILIVDDEKNIVGSLQDILSDEGYEVHTASDGLDALEMIQADPPDLVLLDIWLPGMDGIEVLKAVKAYYPEIQVLIMSGHGTIDTAVKATKLGASDFIEKPFSLDALTQSIEKALKKKQSHNNGKERDSFLRSEVPFCFEMMVDLKKAIKTAARSSKPTLILGEPGSGKELVAQAIHHQSRKSDRPFLKLNCAVRPMQSIQEHLFRPMRKNLRIAEKNAPLGESAEKAVYLTNVDALSRSLQEKLFNALEDAGKKNDSPPEFIPARLYAASSADLADLAAKGDFHPGLYALLAANGIQVPPLREYAENIPQLIKTYFEEFIAVEREDFPEFLPDALHALIKYSWPGNIKELRALLDQFTVTGDFRKIIALGDLPPKIRNVDAEGKSLPASEPPRVKGKAAPRLRQRTLKRSVVLCGSGLHSGIKTGLILQPLPPGSGIIFGDISSGKTVPALLENVQSTDYSTCLGKGQFSVATIEHIMAVLHMYRITNLLIKIGDEAPVMDGSAKDFCQLIEDGEFLDQDDYQDEIVIDRTYSFGATENGRSHITVEPCDTFRVSYHMEYPSPIGIQDFTFEFHGAESFKQEIAPARTFGFLEDVAQLTKMGFGSGGKLDNFIFLGDGKVLNTTLRYENEFVRHKILDIIGDMYLLGKPLRGYIKAHKSGHTHNIGLLKEIQAQLC